MNRDKLAGLLDSVLKLENFGSDVSNNGLQVEGAAETGKVAFGVDASLEMIERAARLGAGFIFVHHGISWGAEPRRLVGVTAGRCRELFNRGISLYAAHLPLDAHPELGHNAQLAGMIGLEAVEPFCSYHGINIGRRGVLPSPASAGELARKFSAQLISPPAVRIWGDPDRRLARVGVVSGGGGFDVVNAALESGCDALVTGEVTHELVSTIIESGLTVIALGHYASETPGVEAVRRLLASEYGVEGGFIDIPTGL